MCAYNIYVISVPSSNSSLLVSPPSQLLTIGQSVTLTCMTSSSNPPASITWDPLFSVMDEDTEVGEYNGSISISIVSFNTTENDAGRRISCNAVYENQTIDSLKIEYTLIVQCEYIFCHFVLS